MGLNLPRCNWVIGASPSRPATTAATDIFATLKTQVQGLKYWKLIESPNTGTTSLIVAQQAVAHVTSSNCNIIIANAITGSTAYRSPDDNTSNATRLQVGITPNVAEAGSGSFKTPNADRPFQSATGNPRWSGYWHWATTTAVSATFIVESEDVIGIFVKDNSSSSGSYGFLAGAIVETHDSGSGENDRRNYGIISSGPALISTTFWSSVGAFTAHNSPASTAHAGVFIVSGGVANGDPTAGLSAAGHSWAFISRGPNATMAYDDFATTHTGVSRQVGFPVPVFATTVNAVGPSFGAPIWALGVFRGMFIGSDDRAALVRIQSGGIDQCYKVTATTNQTTNDALLLGPASGSTFI